MYPDISHVQWEMRGRETLRTWVNVNKSLPPDSDSPSLQFHIYIQLPKTGF